MPDSIKAQTMRGVMWTGVERIANQSAGFVISIVLARLLLPADYGVIGIMNVFLGIAELFIDCGLSSALIQKKDRTEADYSTVFWCNIAMSTLCYALVFAASHWIAGYYRIPDLKGMLRVMGLILIINALYTIQGTRLTALLDFKTQAKVSFSSCVFSGAFGIWMACRGLGPWSLVGQNVFASVYRAIAYWIITRWHPSFIFSRASFNTLFAFGSRLLAASILHTIYVRIAPIIIGRKYSTEVLGIYSRADSLVTLPGSVFQSTLGRVIYPVLVTIKDDETRLRAAYNKYLRIITSLVAPSMLLFAAVSRPLILTLIGEKWIACVPFIMLLALSWMLDPIILVNLNILYVKGRSDIVLKLEIIKKIIAITIVVVSVQFGVIWLCVGRVIYTYIALGINLHACGPFIGMSFLAQMKEVWNIYLGSFVAACCAYAVGTMVPHVLTLSNWWTHLFTLVSACVCGGAVYLIWAKAFRFEILSEAMALYRKIIPSTAGR